MACIADHLEKHLDGFARSSFEQPILGDLARLPFKARVHLIGDHLHETLPADFETRHAVLRAMLHPGDGAGSAAQSDEDGIRGWGTLPLGNVVGRYGLEAFEDSLLLLKEMTSRFSAELDVRYFLLADQGRALSIMESWVADPNRHVRRLVSEGTRPRLPWAMQLPGLMADPGPVLPLLKTLRDDEDEYVRRSVANHLNDIAKDHPDLIAGLAREWMKGADAQRTRLIRHACRTLIKQGHRGALNVFGFRPPALELARLAIEPDAVVLGDSLGFTADLRSCSRKTQLLVIDYVIHFRKANGRLAPKVFKWKTLSLGAGESVSLRRLHPIRAITTRRYYDGRQALSLRINGEDFGFAEFGLTTK